MAKLEANQQLPFIQRTFVYLERFRDVPALAWLISTGIVTITSALLPLFFPGISAWLAILIYVLSMLISLLFAGFYTLRHPSLSQRMLEARIHYKNGCFAFDNNDYENALIEFNKAYLKDPDDYMYTSKYGRVLLRKGEYKETIKIFTKAILVSPTKAGRLISTRNRGVAALYNNNWGPAYRDFNDCLKEKQKSVIYRLLALVDIGMNHIDDAKVHANKAVDLAKTQSAPHSTLSIVLVLSDPEKAQKEFDKALASKHDRGDALYALAQASVVHENIDEAYGRLKKAVLVDSKFSPRARLDPLLKKLREDKRKFEVAIDTQGNESSDDNDDED